MHFILHLLKKTALSDVTASTRSAVYLCLMQTAVLQQAVCVFKACSWSSVLSAAAREGFPPWRRVKRYIFNTLRV